MTPSGAAARGALLGGAWAAFVLAALAAEHALGSGDTFLHAFSAMVFEEVASGSGLAPILAVPLAAASAVGVPLGLLARRLSGGPRRRAAWLMALVVPALWVVGVAALAAFFARRDLAPAGRGEVLLEAFLGSLVGAVAVAPVGLLPALAASLMLEGWTRPAALPRVGMARPAVLRAVLGVLAAATLALALAAARRWPAG